jgi:hypothetical protein
MDVAPQGYNSRMFKLNGFGRLSDVERDIECLRRTKGVHMMLDIIPVWKTHDAPHRDNSNGRNELAIFLHNFRLNRRETAFLRAFGPDNRPLDGSARLIPHNNLNVSADGADH